MSIQTMKCLVCGEEKPATAHFFCRSKTSSLGIYAQCKSCRAKQAVKDRANRTPEQIQKERESRRLYRRNNKELIRSANSEWKSKNREYVREMQRMYRERDKDRYRRNTRRTQLRVNYGITPDDLNGMITSQGGVCAICQRSLDSSTKWLIPHVDHDHKTGKVRALLCGRCNAAIGLFDDNTAVIRASADYIDQHHGHA
jgi:hypothetical protein